MGEAEHAAEHGQQLVNDLLTFAGRRRLHPLGSGVRVSTIMGPEAGTALADSTALEAALLNGALIARDAMPGGGTLTIRTSRAEVAKAETVDGELKPGSYAVLALEDTGTGMGLNMVYGFARQSGGAVTAASTPGRGTTIRLFLPDAK